MANILLKNVSKHFDSVRAIDQVNFEVKKGEFLVLVGPSGCGKSTLLRSIAGLETITGGQIHITIRMSRRLILQSVTWQWFFSPMLSTRT